MIIPLNKILRQDAEHPNRCHDVIENSIQYFEDGGVETKDPILDNADIIVLIQAQRTIFRAVPGYFVYSGRIIVNDHRRSFIDNVKNEIAVDGCIHEIDGYKFTMITINSPKEQAITGFRYYHSANWLW